VTLKNVVAWWREQTPKYYQDADWAIEAILKDIEADSDWTLREKVEALEKEMNELPGKGIIRNVDPVWVGHRLRGILEEK
jgi:hypothetical protein